MTEKVKWFIDVCDEMLDDPNWDWASNTIEGIRNTIEKSGMITERQANAIRNIRAKERGY